MINKITTKNALLLIVGLALLLRLLGAFCVSSHPPTDDALGYTSIAREIRYHHIFSEHDEIPTARRPPLYPLFLAPFANVDPNNWKAARITEAVLNSTGAVLICWLGFLITRRKDVALLGAALYAVHPVFIFYATTLLTESIFLWLWCLALCLVLEGLEEEREMKWPVTAGIALGLCILCRPIPLTFPPFLLIMALFHKPRMDIAKRMIIVIVFTYMTILPWILPIFDSISTM